jgi:hypothetical protein
MNRQLKLFRQVQGSIQEKFRSGRSIQGCDHRAYLLIIRFKVKTPKLTLVGIQPRPI